MNKCDVKKKLKIKNPVSSKIYIASAYAIQNSRPVRIILNVKKLAKRLIILACNK